jgi:hypothetical protein
MKKVLVIFAIAALVACGGATNEVVTDSTAVDTTALGYDTTQTGGGAVLETETSGKELLPKAEEVK